ncbi:MAG: VPLPA-CTERM sorting domain-containing protein [Gammaproteobacteria bacterium]
MKLKTLKGLVATLGLGIAAQSAMANVISLTPLTQTVGPDSKFALELRIDFLEETVGGSLDLFYNTELMDFGTFIYNDDFLNNVVDPAFTLTPDICETNGSAAGGCEVGDAEINAIGFGNFDGIIGSYVVGTFVFAAREAGLASFELASSDSPFGGFISAANASEMTVVFNGAAVLVTPIPAAIWMMLSGLGVLVGVRKKR